MIASIHTALQTAITQTPLRVRREVNGDWTDFFIGAATHEGHCHRLLDASVKVGLHYCGRDLRVIGQMASPSEEIPPYLWQQLQRQCTIRGIAKHRDFY
jgi:hypothetical protein